MFSKRVNLQFRTLKSATFLSASVVKAVFLVKSNNAGLIPSKYAIYVPIREMVLDYNIPMNLSQQFLFF